MLVVPRSRTPVERAALELMLDYGWPWRGFRCKRIDVDRKWISLVTGIPVARLGSDAPMTGDEEQHARRALFLASLDHDWRHLRGSRFRLR